MTRHHKTLPRAFDLSGVGYFLDFVLVPPVAGALIGVGAQFLTAAELLGWLVAGAVLWTFAEYVIHRWLFHVSPWLEPMHQVHHADPKGFVGVASWGTFAGFGLVLAALCSAIGVAACAATAGLMAGYLVYCAIHIRMHHAEPGRLTRYERLMRMRHVAHHRGGMGNFGVSSPLWDFLFRSGA